MSIEEQYKYIYEYIMCDENFRPLLEKLPPPPVTRVQLAEIGLSLQQNIDFQIFYAPLLFKWACMQSHLALPHWILDCCSERTKNKILSGTHFKQVVQEFNFNLGLLEWIFNACPDERAKQEVAKDVSWKLRALNSPDLIRYIDEKKNTHDMRVNGVVQALIICSFHNNFTTINEIWKNCDRATKEQVLACEAFYQGVLEYPNSRDWFERACAEDPIVKLAFSKNIFLAFKQAYYLGKSDYIQFLFKITSDSQRNDLFSFTNTDGYDNLIMAFTINNGELFDFLVENHKAHDIPNALLTCLEERLLSLMYNDSEAVHLERILAYPELQLDQEFYKKIFMKVFSTSGLISTQSSEKYLEVLFNKLNEDNQKKLLNNRNLLETSVKIQEEGGFLYPSFMFLLKRYPREKQQEVIQKYLDRSRLSFLISAGKLEHLKDLENLSPMDFSWAITQQLNKIEKIWPKIYSFKIRQFLWKHLPADKKLTLAENTNDFFKAACKNEEDYHWICQEYHRLGLPIPLLSALGNTRHDLLDEVITFSFTSCDWLFAKYPNHELVDYLELIITDLEKENKRRNVICKRAYRIEKIIHLLINKVQDPFELITLLSQQLSPEAKNDSTIKELMEDLHQRICSTVSNTKHAARVDAIRLHHLFSLRTTTHETHPSNAHLSPLPGNLPTIPNPRQQLGANTQIHVGNPSNVNSSPLPARPQSHNNNNPQRSSQNLLKANQKTGSSNMQNTVKQVYSSSNSQLTKAPLGKPKVLTIPNVKTRLISQFFWSDRKF